MKLVTLLFFAVMLSACASPGSSVIVDRKGVDPYRYSVDLADCGGYAEEVPVAADTATATARGAAVGGAVGAIVDGGEGAARGAGIGGVVGVARGYERAEREQQRVVKNCMRGRGYRVLN